MDITSDDRVQWIRQKVVLALDISIECFNDHFKETLERARSAGLAREQLKTFLSSKCGSGTAIFFASHHWTEQQEIQEEIEVEDEEANKQEGADAAVADGTAGDKPADALVSESKPVPADAKPEADTATPSTGEQTEGEQQVKEKKYKKVIISKMITVAKSKMYMSVEHLLPEMQEKTVAYFIRSFDGNVPQISESSDATAIVSHLEFNVMFGEVLQGIANVMQHIYMPVVQKGKITDDLDLTDEEKAPEARESLRNELNLNIAKFEQQIRHVVVQSKGDTRLTIPNISISNPATAAEDSHIVTEIESAVGSWTKVLLEAVDLEHQKNDKEHSNSSG